ncbi:hypothetical protein WOLCODRAFT_137031 [Wolfiporia cocos MD-104 SS10]|uniref:SET domain-containing protein n=1 Tax=Wolfiporia cocos (strain MD-104) TaxID=742152 RepID=A0A2H3JLU9_WOLCO|nr:hypothetical protein WOLCODRAFT_137031 [Wolfiporia cocos MD-104 SS10]
MSHRELIEKAAYHRRSQKEQEHERRQSKGKVLSRMTITGFKKHCSLTPVELLKPTSLSRMLVRKVHHGHYLLCRTITLAWRLTAVQTIIEDIEGAVCDLSIYNFPTMFDATTKDIDNIFPKGLILAIREPTFKPAAQGPDPLIRIDSPSDIIFVEPNSDLLRGITWKSPLPIPKPLATNSTIESYRAEGNRYFKDSQWLPAAFAYSRGLEIYPDAAVLLLNRAEAYLRLQFFSAALADARRAVAASNIELSLRDKALFREARAEYGLGYFEAAKEKFLRWHETHPQDKDVEGWINRSQRRLEEMQFARYDWIGMFKESQRELRLDVADYIGPIQVTQLDGRGGGRGVVATKDISVGELLLVSKAFVCVSESDLSSKETRMSVDMLSSTLNTPTQSATVSRIVQKIYGNPAFHDFVFHLYAGPDYDPPPCSYPPILPEDPIPASPLRPNLTIDAGRLEAICTYNCFEPVPLLCQDFPPDHDVNAVNPTALYLLPSLLNHSCGSNALWTCIGDVMIIRAIAPISAGTEVTLPYTSTMSSFAERRQKLQKHMLSECDCWLCEENRKDGEEVLRLRDSLVSQLMGGRLRAMPLTRLKEFEKQLESTYSTKSLSLRPELSLLHTAIAERLSSTGTVNAIQGALRQYIKALACLGFSVVSDGQASTRMSSSKSKTHMTKALPIATDRIPATAQLPQHIITIMLRMAQQYLSLGDQHNSAGWIQAAQWVSKTVVGGDGQFFMIVYSHILEHFDLQSFARKVLLV